VDYRPKTNAVILLDMGHTLRERKGNLELNVVDVLPVEE
jgi:hypothetical protein